MRTKVLLADPVAEELLHPRMMGVRRWMSPSWEDARRCLTSSCL